VSQESALINKTMNESNKNIIEIPNSFLAGHIAFKEKRGEYLTYDLQDEKDNGNSITIIKSNDRTLYILSNPNKTFIQGENITMGKQSSLEIVNKKLTKGDSIETI